MKKWKEVNGFSRIVFFKYSVYVSDKFFEFWVLIIIMFVIYYGIDDVRDVYLD